MASPAESVRSLSSSLTGSSAGERASGGAFSGNAMVLCRRGVYRRVDELRKADVVSCGFQRWSHVECVVEYEPVGDVTPLFGKSGVSEWQAVRAFGRDPEWSEAWQLPACVAARQREPLAPGASLYNLVLADHHTVAIHFKDSKNATWAEFLVPTLGHGILHDSVASHSYFGGVWAVRDLRRLDGWSYGRVFVPSDAFERDATSGAVFRMRAKAKARARSPQQQQNEESQTMSRVRSVLQELFME